MSKLNFKQDNNSNKSVMRWQRMFKPRQLSEESQDESEELPESEVSEDINWDIPSYLSDNDFRLDKKKLYPSEIAKFKEIGKPDLSQNYLELFTPVMIEDLFSIMNFGSDNYKKANYILEELEPYGFEEVGEGTNILVIKHRHYPGVVFKIALDTNGIADNFNDELLQRVVPHYTRVFARHSTGIVSVQEYSVTMTKERMRDFVKPIMKLLRKLSETYLIADLSPSRFLNFGINRKGDFVIQDGSDLFPLSQLDKKAKCQNPVGWDAKKRKMKICGGKLEYSADFLTLQCKECGREYNPLELRPKTKEVDAAMAFSLYNGLTPEERLKMEQDEIAAIRAKTQGRNQNVHVDRRESAEPEETTLEVPVEEENDSEIEDTPRQVLAEPVAETDETDDEEEDEIEDRPGIQKERGVSLEYPVSASEEDLAEMLKSMHEETASSGITVIKREDLPEVKSDIVTPRDLNREDIRSSLSDKLKAYNEQQEQVKIQYKIVPVSDDPDAESPGIYLNIKGDFDEAWDECGLPIFVSVDNESTYELILDSEALGNLLSKIIQQLMLAESDE